MSLITRKVAVFLMLAAFVAVSVFAQGGSRGLLERTMWFVDEAGKIQEALYWVIYLGDYDLQLKRNIHGEGQVTDNVTINFQLTSSGAIEGNGFGSKGRVSTLSGMRIRYDDKIEEIKADHIDYIFDYGTKVVTKDGRRGELMLSEGGHNVDVKRFMLMLYRNETGKFGEFELKLIKDREPIVGIAFSKESAAKAAKEPKSY
jgi:hypothetical protein